MSTRKENNTVISHKCNNCGMCCRNRGDISLTPLDVFNISKFLKMSCKDFISKYCETDEDVDVRILAHGMLKACIFLKTNPNGKNKCDIYQVRPMACYLYPLKVFPGRLNVFRKDDAQFCPTSKKSIPISQFVREKSNNRYEYEFYHILRFAVAVDNYTVKHPHVSNQEKIEYFFYNNSIEELNEKLDNCIQWKFD